MRLARLVPDFLKLAVQKVYLLSMDILEGPKERDSMIPPRSMIHVGVGDFAQIGQEFKRHFIELVGMQPDHRVLDVGCGIGRMAVPLTNYLSEKGEYWGFDIVKKGIDWCRSNITSRFGNFHFLHCDVYNQYYNRSGKVHASDYRFPFENETFDFVFLTSVFTHMRPPDLENYLGEISRVLKLEGKCLMTLFPVERGITRPDRRGSQST